MANLREQRKQIPFTLYVVSTEPHEYKEDWVVNQTYQNNPLGAKWNACLTLALSKGANKHFLFLGDDDLVSVGDIQKLAYFCAKYGYVGSKGNYFFDIRTKKSIKFTYQYDCAKLAGAGKMIDRDSLVKAACHIDVKLKRALYYRGEDYATGDIIAVDPLQAAFLACRGVAQVFKNSFRVELFDPRKNTGLDHTMDMHMVGAGCMPYEVELDDGIIDVKSDTNIWDINRVSKAKGAEKVHYSVFTNWLTSDVKKLLTIVD